MTMARQGALDVVPLRRRSVRDARVVSVVVLILAVLIALPFALTRYQVGLASEILIYGILAMSIDILAGFAGRTSLAHGALFGVSAYVVLYSVSTLGLSPVLGVLLGVLAATATAALFALVAARTAGVYFLLLTLALGMIVWGICLRWTDVTGGENGLRGNLRVGSLRDYAVFYWVVLGCAAAASFAMWRLVRSPFGLTLRGIRDSESRMRSLGYNVYLHLVVGFTISGLFAGRCRRALCVLQQLCQPDHGGANTVGAGIADGHHWRHRHSVRRIHRLGHHSDVGECGQLLH